MLARIAIAATAALSAGGYLLHDALSTDPTIFPQSREQVQKILMEARTTLPRRDGPGSVQMWSPRHTERGIMLNMQSAAGAPVLTCRIALLSVSPGRTRVVPECSGDGSTASARARTLEEIHPFMFEEHIHAILNKRAFDRDAVDRRTTAVYARNLGAIQREARSMASRTDQPLAQQFR
jgi:hypothetical protein